MYDLTPDLVVTAHGPVRLVELNRPEQLNAMSEDLHAALARVWDLLAADDAAGAVVLTGRGRAFTAGGNFDVMLISNFKDYPGSFAFSSLTGSDTEAPASVGRPEPAG